MNCAKTAKPTEMPFGLWIREGSRKHIFNGAQIPYAKGIRRKDMPGHARRHFAMSCAKVAEPIGLPFGLWTQVGGGRTSSIVFARLRQCAFMGGHIGATWRIQLNRSSAAAM